MLALEHIVGGRVSNSEDQLFEFGKCDWATMRCSRLESLFAPYQFAMPHEQGLGFEQENIWLNRTRLLFVNVISLPATTSRLSFLHHDQRMRPEVRRYGLLNVVENGLVDSQHSTESSG